MTSNYEEDDLHIEQLDEKYSQREVAKNGRENEEVALEGVLKLGEGINDLNGMQHINANLSSKAMAQTKSVPFSSNSQNSLMF